MPELESDLQLTSDYFASVFVLGYGGFDAIFNSVCNFYPCAQRLCCMMPNDLENFGLDICFCASLST